jgi:1-phosphatidylinositol-4-phosphate 5-kinase
MESLDLSLNRDQAFSAGEASGKSGSFFFFSHDNHFLIKTMNGGERSLFLKMLPDYLAHLKTNRNSVIARIYGIFTVKMEDVSPVSLVMMSNTA